MNGFIKFLFGSIPKKEIYKNYEEEEIIRRKKYRELEYIRYEYKKTLEPKITIAEDKLFESIDNFNKNSNEIKLDCEYWRNPFPNCHQVLNEVSVDIYRLFMREVPKIVNGIIFQVKDKYELKNLPQFYIEYKNKILEIEKQINTYGGEPPVGYLLSLDFSMNVENTSVVT